MARNEEKAQSMLYRFREAMLIEAGLKRNPNDSTPLLPETCNRLPIAEQARKDLLREISRKITRIQDSSLDDDQLRALNDELNELSRTKYAWDRRIHELGGIGRRSVQVGDRLGLETPNVHGKFYFGRAKELPEAKEALNPHREVPSDLAKEKLDLQSRVNPQYYGFEDDEDETMLQEERRAEEALSQADGPLLDWVTGLPTVLPPGISLSVVPASKPDVIPTQEEVQKYLVDRRKAALLKRLEGH